MTVLNNSITLMGHVDDFNLDGFEKEALNFVFERLDRGNLPLSEAVYIGEESVYHYTYRDKSRNQTCSIFYRFGNQPSSHLSVYGIGKHTGDSNKDYKLITYIDKKEQRYTLNPHNKDGRYKPLYPCS